MEKKSRIRKRKCLCCGQLYLPDRRAAKRQRYCSAPECQKASKAHSQKRWLAKPQNRTYFRDALNVQRVQAWRQAHPGYWRRVAEGADALQEETASQQFDQQRDASSLAPDALQDVSVSELPVLVGLIASLTGSTLQEDIDPILRSYHACGQRILGIGPGRRTRGERDDVQASSTA